MMTLDEAILHCEEKAKLNKELAEMLCNSDPMKMAGCYKCAEEHEQLAEWLKELKALKEIPQGDLISREALKKALHNFFDGKVIDEPAYILRDVFCHIDSAPTTPLPDFKEGYKQAIIDGKTNFSRPQGEYTEEDIKHKVYRNEKCDRAGKCLDYIGYHCAGCNGAKKGGA